MVGTSVAIAQVYINDLEFNVDKAGYPASPTVMSGVEIVRGQNSCFEHAEPATARSSLWLPKTHADQMPKLGDKIEILTVINGQYNSNFIGWIETVLAQDTHETGDAAGWRINVTAGDVIKKIAKQRLTDKPWPYERAYERYMRIRDLLANVGISLDLVPTDYLVELAYCQPRDVDSFNALEACQQTAMAFGTVFVGSFGGHAGLAEPLNLPVVMASDQSDATTKYAWLGTKWLSRSVQTVGGVETRRNLCTNPTNTLPSSHSALVAGPGGSVTSARYPFSELQGTLFSSKFGPIVAAGTWNVASTGTGAGHIYTESYAGASGVPMSGGVWVKHSIAGYGIQCKISFVASDGTTIVGTKSSSTVTINFNEWTYIKCENAVSTGAFTTVRIEAIIQSSVSAGFWHMMTGHTLEQKTTTAGFFDGDTLDAAANVIMQEVEYYAGRPLVTIPASAMQDDAFSLDHANVVNQVNLNYQLTIDGRTTFNDKVLSFTDAASATLVPQSRAIASDFAWDTSRGLEPIGRVVRRTANLLGAQSNPKWRLASTVRIVLSELPYQTSLSLLFSDWSFGYLVKVTGVDMIDQYMRVRGYRLLIGADPEIELDLEPVDYAAPQSITRDSMFTDNDTNRLNFQNFKTLTCEDLRSIGSR